MSTFFATTITLLATKTSLLDYVTAVASGAGHTNTGLSAARQIDFEADSANTGTVSIGDSSVAATDFGRKLAAGAVYEINKVLVNDRISLADVFLLPSAAGQKVNVSIVL